MKKPKSSHENMQRTALFFRPQQIAALQALSDETGAPVAELVRRAVDAYLKERKIT
jgi:predicted DNA-binding protein